jgi:tRNA U54 and U55 pseudouridine synthase Pus10
MVTIHMKQGTHQQSAMLTREEYRKTLAMEFAFPSANDFTRVNTTVSLAPDERSAKVSYKTTQTLLQSNREFKIEGDETFVVRMLGKRPMIVSLEKVVPGDSM